MPAQWSRRALLASVATAGVAGCLGTDDGGTDTPTKTESVTPVAPDELASDWRAPGYDHRRTHATTEATGPTEQVAELWSTEVVADLTQPVVADGTLFVGTDDGVVHAFDGTSGDRRWQQAVGDVAGTPRVVDGAVYVPTGDSVVALDPTEGTEQWRQPSPDRRDLVVAPHGLYSLHAPEDTATVVARHLGDGSERWRTELDGDWTPRMFASDDRLYVPVAGMGPWSLDLQSGETARDRLTAAEDAHESQLYRDGAIFTAEPFFGAVDARTPPAPYDYRWTSEQDGYSGYELAAGPERVYFQVENGEEPGLYALATETGDQVWRDPSVGELLGPPVVAGGVVLLRTTDDLRGVDPATGSELWRYLAEGVGTRPAVVDDVVFTTHDGTARALRPP